MTTTIERMNALHAQYSQGRSSGAHIIRGRGAIKDRRFGMTSSLRTEHPLLFAVGPNVNFAGGHPDNYLHELNANSGENPPRSQGLGDPVSDKNCDRWVK